MPIITDAARAREVYDEARECGTLILNLNTESRRMTEAIYKAAYEFGREIGVDDLPVVLSICGCYDERPQVKLNNYLNDPLMGFDFFMSDARVLSGKNSPYSQLRIMPHLDHGQVPVDQTLLYERADDLVSVMFDGSIFPMDENIRRTAEYVDRFKDKLVIEGAVDEIAAAETGEVKNEPTTVEDAARFLEETGVDLIVPNVGTEHRATAQEKHYLVERARELRAAVGKKLVLHGASSLDPEQYGTLADDGIIKMNYYTGICRNAVTAELEYKLKHVNEMLPAGDRRRFADRGLIPTELLDDSVQPTVDMFADANTRRVYIERASEVVKETMEQVGYRRFAG